MTTRTTRFVVVTGTDTGVGKTVVTAALAVLLGARGLRVCVVKPVQTGLEAGEPGDCDEVSRLTGLPGVQELARLRHPLAPETAARLEQRDLPSMMDVARHVSGIDAEVVVVEGAGGVLVRMDLDGGTVLDLACALRAEVVVVAGEGLGTLNHSCLTIDRVRSVGRSPHLVLGSCSADPGLTERSNHVDLPRLTGAPLVGALPEGAAGLAPSNFRRVAPSWFVPGAF